MLTKQTANLAKAGKFITYDYDYHRLTGINYPDHPENNVKYYYGGRNASQNRIGRLMLREDGTGAIEYFYGKMGEVTKTRRTLIVPNQAIATYVTQWTYDSHNRLLEMIYPDEEKVTYSYNLGGQLEKVRGYKSYGYDYVNRIGYDKFEQRTYLKYCNGAETFYTYEPARRRLQNLTVNAGGKSIMDNGYTYDALSNVLSVANKAALPESGKAGGQMAHAYTYDALYRLASATGTYAGADSKTASYRLEMGYDNMHRIVSKKQHLTQQGVQFDGTLHVGYDLAYTYGKTEGRKFQLAEVKDANYRTEENPDSVAKVDNSHTYTYDANGNLVYVNTGRIKQDGALDSTAAERKLRWDEENRLTASDDNGFVTNYWYDADGERTVKTSGEGEQLYVNSEFAGGRYTKHIYIGSQRIVSKIGDFASYGSDPRRIQYAGSETDGLSVNYKQKYSAQQQVIKDNHTIFEVPYNGTDNNDYVDGQGLLLALSAALGNLQTSLHFARWHDNSAATTVHPKLRKPVPWHWKTTSRIWTHTRSCSSTTIPTTWAAAATSPTWTARWFSTSSMCRSAKCSLKSGTASGIRLISSTRRNSTRRRDCITMVQGTMTRG